MKTITTKEAISKLKKLKRCREPETQHIEGDKILCELLVSLGQAEVVKEFDKLTKWYS